jgi:serine/threonine protein kinase
MALSSGFNLGSYEILGPLGKGGMGEVYRARDTKLGRDVAIKVLPEDDARNAERVARFQREAQVLASLNHPNVAAIHDIENHDGTDFLILELVEGETLAERLSRGAIPADEAVEIGKQIAEALSAAHEKGIVHRDLKPANVKITPAGSVKVLDFGLAKFLDEAAASDLSLSQSPTVMSAHTGGGVILGTVSYMSPEQARGRAVTKQADIWAFGCVLFEMLTQRQCYTGETVSDTIAKILKDEPDWRALEAAVPISLQRIVSRCLQKDPRRRFHDAADIRLELEEALVLAPSNPAPPRPRRTFALAALILAMLVLGVVGGAWYGRLDSPERNWTGTLLNGPSAAVFPRVSPDGKMLAFYTVVDGQSQVAVMDPRSGNWTVLTHEKEQGSLNSLNWAADGTRIYFDRMQGGPRGVFSVPALGGESRLILEDACSPVPLPDGSIVVVRINAERAGQLYRFKPDESSLQPLNGVVQSLYGAPVRTFPDGRQLVFYGRPADQASTGKPYQLHILDLQTGAARPIAPDFRSDISLAGIGGLGLAVNPIDRSVLVGMKVGDLHQVVSVPSDGKEQSRVLLTLTEGSWGMDMTPDGTLFIDQVSRPVEILRFNESDVVPTSLAVLHKGMPSALDLPDRGILITTVFNGRSRLSVVKPNKEIVPFVETEDETHEPLAFAGPNRVAFVLGAPPEESIGIASIRDGRLLKRLNVPASSGITTLAASNDGTTLFYSSGGAIWSIPAAGGTATKLGAGDAVSYDPSRQDLVVYFFEQTVRLVRMPTTGGPTESLELPEGLRVEALVGPASIRHDGKIVLSVLPRGSWFLGAAVFDARSGTLRRIPLRYDADLFSLSWNHRNEIVTGAFLIRSNVWRFQLQTPRSALSQ